MTQHYHCPLNCEHPQPFLSLDGRHLCGRCATEGRLTEVVPCTPETCPEDLPCAASQNESLP